MADGGASDGGHGKPAHKVVRCPICSKPATDAFKPFCSKRCSDIDLGKWFSNAYAIPGQPADDESESRPPASDDVPDRD